MRVWSKARGITIWLVVGLFLAGVLGVSACTPQSKETTTEPGSQQTVGADFVWSAEADCSMCHADKAASMDDAALLASKHSANECVICHESGALSESHAGVTSVPSEEQVSQIKKNTRSLASQELCLSCHDSLEALAAKTAKSAELKDKHENIVNPHAIPANAEHDGNKVGECYNCHKIHKASPAVNSNCTTCHHDGVFECGTCHEV